MRHYLLLIIMPFALSAFVFFVTKNQLNTYKVNTTIYTGLASGSSISALEGARLDLLGTRTDFDNLIKIVEERNTIEEVSLQLLTTHLMMDAANDSIISKKSFEDLKEIIPKDVNKIIIKDDFQKTLENIRKYKDQNHQNFIYQILNNDHPNYSIEKISHKLKVRRVHSSDFIEITYNSNDPGICKNTVSILTDIVIDKYSQIKNNQSGSVVDYFLEQLEIASKDLEEAENRLMKFNQDNQIINYYEQTKHVASEKEHFELTYLDIRLKNVAAESVLQSLEGKMSSRQKQKLNNDKILNLRNKLSDINVNISLKTYDFEKDSTNHDQLIDEIANLKRKAIEVQNELSTTVRTQFLLDNTIDGVPTAAIISDWIAKVIEFESTKAQLLLGDVKRKEYQQLYVDYAPLGAQMKRIERKISVAEREYLSILHSLGLAKLKKQNVKINANLQVVEEPLFPIQPEPSKRKYIIILSFMLGFVIPAFTILLLDFFDQNLNTSKKAEDRIGLKVDAIFPNFANPKRKVDVEVVKQRGVEIIARKLILNSTQKGNTQPEINLVFSTLNSEGKTTIIKLLLEELSKSNLKVLFLTHQQIEEETNFDVLTYEISSSFHRIETIDEVINDSSIDLNQYEYIFCELPGILYNTYPIKLFNNVHGSYLVTRANRPWKNSDDYSLEVILETIKNNKPKVILNGIRMEEMESVLGNLPKQKNFLNKIVTS